MKRFVIALLAATVAVSVSAQSPTAEKDGSASLDTLVKKIDEQNAKLDALSQQLLKLEQQITAIRPGVMIGEATPSATSANPAVASASSPTPAADAGNAHVVTKGETLTSIAKSHKVGVQDLQKFNHIENDRALQIGQTIMIPNAPGASPAASATGSPNE